MSESLDEPPGGSAKLTNKEWAAGANGRQGDSAGISVFSEERLQLEREKVRAELAAREAADEFGRVPIIVRMSDVQPEDVDWLVYPYLPRGKIVELGGDPGVGKTWLALAFCGMVSTGDFTQMGGKIREPANALFMTAEDGLEDTIAQRLTILGADQDRIYTLTGWKAHDADGKAEDGAIELSDLDILGKAIRKVNPVFVFVDPLQAYLGSDVDMHRSNQTRPILAGLAAMSQQYGHITMLNRHLRKSGGDAKAIYMGLGSIDFTAAARSVLLAARDPDALPNESKFILAHSKSNLAPLGAARRYELQPDRFLWGGTCELTADMLVVPPEQDKELEPSARDEAREFLLEELAECEVRATTVRKHAGDVGIKKPTLDRAKKDLRFRAIRRDGVWYWPQLGPNQEPQPPKGDIVDTLDTLDTLSPDSGALAGQGPQEYQEYQESHVREGEALTEALTSTPPDPKRDERLEIF